MTAPHSFLFKHIRQMYADCETQGLFDKLEPHTTNFMVALGLPIYFSKGDQKNIKITTREDLLLFEGFLLAKQKNGLL